MTQSTLTSSSTDNIVFSREESLQKSLKYFNGDKLAAEVFLNKYALKDYDGNLLEQTPDDMHRRLAKEFARIEKKYPNSLSENEIYNLIKDFKYVVPQGSPMAGIGNDHQVVSLSNCFVIGNKGNSDSYGGIMKLDQELVQLQKRRAGVGLDLSFIRPKGSLVKNSALTSTGIVPFMERYSNSTREVAQDGRRGALMESISIKHPDAEDFIDAKTKKGKVTGANVSVRIDDEFMEAAIQGTTYTQMYPVEQSKLIPPKVIKEIDAQKLWKKIIHNAWKSAEPGILFWDTIINESIPDCYDDLGFKTTSTNPCGEIGLCPDDSCRLTAINLYSYVDNPFSDEATFDYDLLQDHVFKAQKLMDDLIDLELEKIDKILEKIESDPEPEIVKQTEKNLWNNIKEKCIEGRRTGLGVTAEGDMLAAMGIRYGTDEANNFVDKIHQTIKLSSYRSSMEMAKERGVFPIWDGEREEDNPFLLRIKEEDPELYYGLTNFGRRNIALLTIAPTGSVSIMTRTTSGVECVFLILHWRKRKINPNDKNVRVDFVDEVGDKWQEYLVFHPKFEKYLEVKGYNVEEVKTWNEKEIIEVIKKSPYYKATSRDVDWIKKVEMQGTIQKHVDHSISVTVNLPKDATEEVVSKVYETGWKHNCKGITVYRDGSRSGVLTTESIKKEEKLFKDNHAPKRPKRLKCDIIRFQNNLEKWIAVIGLLDGRPYEIFTGRLYNGLSEMPTSVVEGFVVRTKVNGESKYDLEYMYNNETVLVEGLSDTFNPEYWNYAKFISSVLRHGMPITYVYNLISSLTLNDEYLNTWKNGVGRVIKKYIPNGSKADGKCSNCGESDGLEFIEGCLTCKICSYSACS